MNKKFLLSGLLGCLLLCTLFAACRVVDVSALPHNPAVGMGSSQFEKQEITITKGQSLDLNNTSSTNHVINNGSWKNGQKDETAESNAPKVSSANLQQGQSVTVGPFTTAGDYNYLCTIHPGMAIVVHVTG